MHRAIVVLMALLMAISTASVIGLADDGPDQGSSRTTHELGLFDGGISSSILTYPPAGATLQNVSFTLPKGCLVNSASMDIEGIRVTEANTFYKNYNDTKNNTAWNGTAYDCASKSLSSLMQTPYLATDYFNVSAIDSTTTDFMNMSYMIESYELYKFNLTQPDYDSIELYWVGGGFAPLLSMGTTNISVYNFTKKGFDTLLYISSLPNFYGSFGIDLGIGANYVQSGSKLLYVLVNDQAIVFTGMNLSWTMTDYIGVNLTKLTSNAPSAIELDMGSDGSKEYTHAGVFETKVTLGDAQGLKTAIQQLVDSPSAPANVKINVSVRSATQGKIRLSALHVNYSTNQAPQYNSPIPNSVQFDEDDATSGLALLNVTDHFSDDSAITRVIIEKKVPAEADIQTSIASNGIDLDFTSALDYFGIQQFRIIVYDSGLDGIPNNADDRSASSQFFNVTVRPTDDPPVIMTVSGRAVTGHAVSFTGTSAATEDSVFRFDVSFVDIDDDLATFSSNSTNPRFILDPVTGNATFSPTQADVGMFHVQVVATEVNATVGTSNLLNDFVNITIEVKNSNDAPYVVAFKAEGGARTLYKPGSTTLSCVEDETTNWTIECSDEDGGPIAISLNETHSGMVIIGDVISYSPLQANVGLNLVNITITDSIVQGYAQIAINVINKNDAPVVDGILVKSGDDNLTKAFEALGACDEDGDALTYSWDFGDPTPVSTGNGTQHSYSAPGNYTVVLTVSDGKLHDIASVVVTVTPIGGGSVSDDDVVDDDTDDDVNVTDDDTDDDVSDDDTQDNEGSNLPVILAIVAAAILLFAVVAVILFIMLRKKKGQAQGAPPSPQGPAPGATPQPIQSGSTVAAPIPAQYPQTGPRQNPGQQTEPGQYPGSQYGPGQNPDQQMPVEFQPPYEGQFSDPMLIQQPMQPPVGLAQPETLQLPPGQPGPSMQAPIPPLGQTTNTPQTNTYNNQP